jgi:vacuolar-type H+-ATPase subunit I/STV1
MKDILVPISPGELLDKITILRIKSARMTDETKLRNVRVELEALEQTWRESGAAIPAVAADENALQKVNEELWDIEDRIRDKERAGEFDAVFIELARAVYVTNDERARFKKNINTALGSRLVEEKSYQPYR